MVMAKGESLRHAFRRKETFKWVKFLDLEFGHGGLLKGDKFIDFLYAAMNVSRFEDLQIPLQVVTTDFNSSEQVVISSGELLDAVKASMALPGLFTPVRWEGRVLIDGGSVNPVPFDLFDDCDVVVGINVMGEIRRTRPRMPSLPPRQRAPHPPDSRRAQAIAQAAPGLPRLRDRRALSPPHPPRPRRQLAAGGSGRPRRIPAGDRPPAAPTAGTSRPRSGAPGGSARGLRAQSWF